MPLVLYPRPMDVPPEHATYPQPLTPGSNRPEVTPPPPPPGACTRSQAGPFSLQLHNNQMKNVVHTMDVCGK